MLNFARIRRLVLAAAVVLPPAAAHAQAIEAWVQRYNRPENGSDVAFALAVDAGGNVFVTGKDAVDQCVTLAYSNAGVPLWTNTAGGSWGMGNAAAVDSSGNAYVTGCSIGSGGDNDFATVKYVAPPIITRQPLSCTNSVGTTANFTVEAVGSLPFDYQWRRAGTNLLDGGNLCGVKTSNLQIATLQLADACGYTVVVTNAWGSATSHVAQLTVTIPPSPGRFTNFTYSPVMGFSFIFRDGTIGQPYRIQRSPSLAEGSWTDWMNFVYTEPIVLTDLGALTSTHRFYRAVSP